MTEPPELTDAMIDAEEERIPELALKALREAQARAMASGLPVVLIEGENLIRIDSTGKTILGKAPPQHPVETRFKRATK